MIRKLFLTFTAAMIGAASTSCSEDVPECPNNLCVMAGGWKLVEIQFDGETSNADFSKYQLVLNSPTPTTESTGIFQRTQISGTQDSGSWSVENTNPDSPSSFKGSILRLKPGDNPLRQEDWSIESFTLRQMVLVMNRDTSGKDGPAQIRFVLVPF